MILRRDENRRIILLKQRMAERQRAGQSWYQTRQINNFNHPIESRRVKLEKLYENYALFIIPRLFGETRECYSYDEVQAMMEEI